MNETTNEPQTERRAAPGLVPSNSTVSSGAIGIPCAIIFSWLLSLKGITMPIGVEAAFGGLISTLAGYLPRSGRQ